ncbi:MAG: DUF192 domain-containing protein [Verrucomicrobiota bacterium]
MKRRPPLVPAIRAVFASAVLMVLAGGCKSGGHQASSSLAPGTSPGVVVQADGRAVPFRVEVASTPEEHARGLMYRSHLDVDAGMLFVFDQPQVQRFWMKNTLIPLDMIFIGADRRIAGVVENAAPETETERMVPARSQYVLEIGGGLAARLGIHAGELVELHGIPQP